MLHTITERLEICIDINIEISEGDHYTWIFTSIRFGWRGPNMSGAEGGNF